MRGKCLYVVVLASFVAAVTSAVGGGKQTGEEDLKKLQGTWQFVSHEMDGKAGPPEEVAKMKIDFTGNKWALREGDMVIQEGTQKLDPTQKPAHIDAMVTGGADKGSAMLGIYELKGDTIKCCFDPEGKQRPTSFT